MYCTIPKISHLLRMFEQNKKIDRLPSFSLTLFALKWNREQVQTHAHQSSYSVMVFGVRCAWMSNHCNASWTTKSLYWISERIMWFTIAFIRSKNIIALPKASFRQSGRHTAYSLTRIPFRVGPMERFTSQSIIEIIVCAMIELQCFGIIKKSV